MKISLLLLPLILQIVQGQITIFIRQDAEMNQNCMLLITCISGPIQGNLFWYATVDGAERRFARNDGGNAEPNPPYNEISLTGVRNYNTWVTREIIGDNLFTFFNSTLSFNIQDLVNLNITEVLCGSTIINSTAVYPLAGKLKNDGSFILKEDTKGEETKYVCTGYNVPLTLSVNNCILSDDNVIQWFIDERSIFSNELLNLSNRSCEDHILYTVQNYIISIDDSTANITSILKPCKSLSELTLQCGLKFNRSNTLDIHLPTSSGFQPPKKGYTLYIALSVAASVGFIIIILVIAVVKIVIKRKNRNNKENMNEPQSSRKTYNFSQTKISEAAIEKYEEESCHQHLKMNYEEESNSNLKREVHSFSSTTAEHGYPILPHLSSDLSFKGL